MICLINYLFKSKSSKVVQEIVICIIDSGFSEIKYQGQGRWDEAVPHYPMECHKQINEK